MHKRLIASCITCVMLISSTLTGFASDEINKVRLSNNKIEMNLMMNKKEVRSAKSFKSSSYDTANSLQVTLKQNTTLKANDYNDFSANGFLFNNGNKYRLEAEGTLFVGELENDSVFYQGHLYGDLYDKKGSITDEIALSIQYDKQENKGYTSLTIGELSNDGKEPVFLDFGEIATESNKIYFEKKLKKSKRKNSNKKVKNSSLRSLYSQGETAKSIRLQEYDDYYDRMYLALYHANEVNQGDDTNFFIRTWANTDEVEEYYEDRYDEYVVKGSGQAEKVYFYIKNEPGWQAEGRGTPYDDNKNVELLIPIPLPKIGVQLINTIVNVDSVDYRRDNVSGSSSDNKAKWTFKKSFGFTDDDNINAESTRPWNDEDDENGLSGRVEFSYDAGDVIDEEDMNTYAYAKWYYSVVVHSGGYTEKDIPMSLSVKDYITVNED